MNESVLDIHVELDVIYNILCSREKRYYFLLRIEDWRDKLDELLQA